MGELSLGETKKLELLRLILEDKKFGFWMSHLSNLDEETIDILAHTFQDHRKRRIHNF